MTAYTLKDEFGLNDEQAAAATTVDRHVCVEAGAGSGKTRVLVARLVGLLEPGRFKLDEVVAITFTRKAASEMRERLREAFRQRSKSSEPKEQSHWRDLIRRLETARINTIDGFCASLLREHSVRLGIDPDFVVLDDSESLVFRNDLVRAETMKLLESGHPGARRYAEEHGVKNLVDSIIGLLGAARTVSAAADALPMTEPEALLAAWKEQAERDSDDRIRRCVDDFGYDEALERMEAAAGHCLDAQDKMEVTRCSMIASLRILLTSPSRDKAANAFASIHACRRGLGAKDKWPDAGLLAELRSLVSRVKDGEEAYGVSTFDHEVESRAAALTVDLYGVFSEVSRAYREKKRRASTMDFEDLLAETADALENDAELRHELRGTFKHILVDEFQDTDPLQYELISRLRAAHGDPGAILFIVGDVKQAIYGFRGADVDVFEQAKADHSTTIGLPRNYRSDPALIRFINDFYSITGRLSTHGRRYDALVPDRAPGAASAIAFLIPEDEKEKLPVAEYRRREAVLVAGCLQSICTGGAQVRDGNAYRNAGFGDAAILFRKRTAMAVYERVLREAGVPFVVEQGRGYFDRQEIHDIVNLLKFIANPWDEIALLGFLRSPLASISDESLMRLASDTRLAQAFHADFTLPDPEQHRRLERARGLFRRCQSIRHAAVSELLNVILEQTGFEAAQLGLRHAVQRASNVRKLLDTAERLSEARSPDLRAFIRYVSEFHTYELVESEAPWVDDGGGAVTLMTVHKSKGLEFPIVVLADTGRTPSRAPHENPIVFDRHFGLASAIEGAGGQRAKPVVFKLAAAAQKARELDEEARVLYVAMTRAKDHLLIAGGPRLEKESWLAWHDAAYGVLKSADGAEIDAGGSTLKMMRRSSTASTAGAGEPPPAGLDVNELARRVQPLDPEAFPPEELSVHALLDLIESPQLEFDRAVPAASMPRGTDPRLRGTLAHRLFEMWDAASGNAPDYRAILQPYGLLSAEANAVVDYLVRCRATFERSPMFKWMAVASNVQRELPFVVPFCGRYLNGVIDALLDDGTLVDYKTGAKTEARLARYTRQLHLYAHALRTIKPELVSTAVLYYIDSGEVCEVDISHEAVRATVMAAQNALPAWQREGS